MNDSAAPSERQMLRRAAGGPVVGPDDEGKTRLRVVSHGRDLRLRPGEGVSVFAHRTRSPATA